MNYQCQFVIEDKVTGVLYQSAYQTFFHDKDVISLRWKDVFVIMTNKTAQSFHIYLEPYLLEKLTLKNGRIHWFSASAFETVMKDECTKVTIFGKDLPENVFSIQRVKIRLFMNNLEKHQHKMLSVIQYIRPGRRCLFIGRAQNIFEQTDQKRIYTWFSQKEPVPFPGVRMLQGSDSDMQMLKLTPLLSPKRPPSGTLYIPDNPLYSNEVRALPITIVADTVLEIKFYNSALFLFEVVLKYNVFNFLTPRVSPRERTYVPELQTYTYGVNDFFTFEVDYCYDKGIVTILSMRVFVLKYKVAMNMEHNKNGLTI